jgi:outer membrane receptor protein involved in Fe transport
MKRIILLLAIFCSVLSAQAQFGGGGSAIVGKISGTVIDSITKKPVDYATISVFHSGGKVPMNGVVTDEKGSFKLNNLPAGKYKITVAFIGYATKTFDPIVTSGSKPDNNMGTITLASSSKSLSQVNVVGQKALIETRIDKIVYNAEKDLTSVGGNASDVLRKVPLVAVDINGNVSLRGDQNVKVLINGKPSGAMANNLADVLRSFPADQIKSIEVITSPSAKYDAEGTAGIINIITKSKNISGVSGAISGGIGTRQNNGNANLNIKQNRLSITGNFGGNFTWPQVTPTTFHSYNDSLLVTNDQVSSRRIKRYAYTGSGEVSYDFNNFNAIHSSIRFNQGGFKTDGTTLFSLSNPSQSGSYTGDNNSKTVFGGFDWIADYTHKFKQEGHELTVSGEWSHSTTDVNYTNQYSAFTPIALAAIYPNQLATNGGANNEYTAQVDYTLPVSKRIKMEAGGKSISRIISSTSDFFSKTSSQPDYVYNPASSNIYDYNQYVYAGYAVFTFTLPKSWLMQVGARDESTKIDGKSANPNLGLSPFSNDYNTFVPSFAISKQFGSQTFKLSYSKRIQRPSLQFLNPFINKSNPQNQSQGNPNLAPETSQSVELNYSTYIGASVINASVYYKRTNNIIESQVIPMSTTNPVTYYNLTTYNNIGTNNSFGSTFFGSVTPIKPLTFRTSINVFTYDAKAAAQYANLQSNDGISVQYNIFGSGSLTLDGGFTAETFAVLNSRSNTIQGKNPSFGFIGFGIRKDVMKKKASIGINTLSPFKNAIDFDQEITSRHFVQTSHTAFPFRSVGLTFSYNFGKVTFKQDNPMAPKKTGLNDDLKGGDQNGTGGGPR